VTGMVDEIKKTGSADGASGAGNKKGLGLSGLSGSELKAKVVGIMNSGTSAATGSSKVGTSGAGGSGTKRGYIDNDTDGSSEERPPTVRLVLFNFPLPFFGDIFDRLFHSFLVFFRWFLPIIAF
jgi:hypothetical protein